MKYNIYNDHSKIKEQIKEWELAIDALLASEDAKIDSNTGDVLAEISQEMMAINI